MRRVPNKLVKMVLILSVAWSAVGMELDVFTGPLPPVKGLGVILDLLFTGPPQRSRDDPVALGYSTAASGDSVPSHDGNTTDPSLALSRATWPLPFVALSIRPKETRKSSPISLDSERTYRMSELALKHPVGEVRLSAMNLPFQLCRLNC
jgi:hypothetical protein